MHKEKTSFRFKGGKLQSNIHLSYGRVYVHNSDDFGERLSYWICHWDKGLDAGDFRSWDGNYIHVTGLHQFVRGLVDLSLWANVDEYSDAVKRDENARKWLQTLDQYHRRCMLFFEEGCPMPEDDYLRVHSLSQQEYDPASDKLMWDVCHAKSIVNRRTKALAESTPEVPQT